jgi:hypothetical protein
MPTSIFGDGSPRYDHGHDRETGETWWASSAVTSESRCLACFHEHPVGTTCLQCEACRALDLTRIATDIFSDLLPGGAEAIEASLRHNEGVRLHAACDGRCGVAGCREPYIDEAGLTRHRRPV